MKKMIIIICFCCCLFTGCKARECRKQVDDSLSLTLLVPDTNADADKVKEEYLARMAMDPYCLACFLYYSNPELTRIVTHEQNSGPERVIDKAHMMLLDDYDFYEDSLSLAKERLANARLSKPW